MRKSGREEGDSFTGKFHSAECISLSLVKALWWVGRVNVFTNCPPPHTLRLLLSTKFAIPMETEQGITPNLPKRKREEEKKGGGGLMEDKNTATAWIVQAESRRKS